MLVYKGKQDIPFSVFVTFDNDDQDFLLQTLTSIDQQQYKNIQVFVIPRSGFEDRDLLFQKLDQSLKSFKTKINLIKVKTLDNFILRINEQIASDSKSNYTLFLDAGDYLERGIFFKVAKLVRKEAHPQEMLYLDEAKFNKESGKIVPFYKTDWNPDTCYSKNYLGNAIFFNSKTIASLGYFNIDFKYAFLYDLALKVSEHSEKITHLQELLFTKKNNSDVHAAAKHKEEIQAIKDSLDRQNVSASVELNNSDNSTYSVKYNLIEESKVSIIIPSRNQGNILNTCLESIYRLSTYNNYEIVLIDNGSDEKAFFEVLERWNHLLRDRFKVIRLDIPFNYSKLNNKAVEVASGDYLLFLNNDVEIITPNWIEGMLSHAQRESVGTVGVKLLYPNNRVQHAGVILGVNGVASHSFINMEEDESANSYLSEMVTNYSVLTAACLMVKKSTFLEVDGFDEKYEVEFNDYDLCLRLKEKGYNNVYTPDVKLYHYESYSRGVNKFKSIKSMWQYKKEKKTFMNTWKHYVYNDPCYNPNLSKMPQTIFEPK